MKLDIPRLKLALLRKRVSKVEFAHRIDKDEALVGEYLMGHRHANEEIIKKMAKVLEVSVGFLTGEAMIAEEGDASDLYEIAVNKAYLEVTELLKIIKGQHLLLMDKHFDAMIHYLEFIEKYKECALEIDSSSLQIIYQLQTLNDEGKKAILNHLSLLMEVPKYQNIQDQTLEAEETNVLGILTPVV